MRLPFLILMLVALFAACDGPDTMMSSTSTSSGSGDSTSTTATTSSTMANSSSVTSGSGGADGGSASAHVTARVVDAHQAPIAGAPVVVHDAVGAVVATLTTGADGKVAAVVPAGGSVSAFGSTGLAFEAFGVIDPPDGATVALALPAVSATVMPPPPTTFQLNIAQIPAATRALSTYSCKQGVASSAAFPLGAPATQTYVVTNAPCAQDPLASFLTIAYDIANTPVAWAAALDKAVSPGAVVPVPMAMIHTGFDVLSAAITAIPPALGEATIEVQPHLAAQSSLGFTLARTTPSTAGSFSGSFATPAGLFSRYEVRETVALHGAQAETHVQRSRSYAHLPAASSFAANTMALVSVDPLDVSTPARASATWTVGSGARGDVGRVVLRWSSGTATHAYTLVFPPSHATSVRLPELPAELGAYAPSATSTITSVTVEYADDETVDGYAASSVFLPPTLVDGLGVVTSDGSNMTAVL